MPKSLGRALPPSFVRNPKEQQLFLVRPSYRDDIQRSAPHPTKISTEVLVKGFSPSEGFGLPWGSAGGEEGGWGQRGGGWGGGWGGEVEGGGGGGGAGEWTSLQQVAVVASSVALVLLHQVATRFKKSSWNSLQSVLDNWFVFCIPFFGLHFVKK